MTDASSTGSGATQPRPATSPATPPTLTPADSAGSPPPAPGSPPPPPSPTSATQVVGSPPPPTGATTAVHEPPPPTPPAAVPVRRSRPGFPLLPIAIGVGLLAAAVVLSSTRARADGDLDWSNYGVGLGATATLLLVALAALAIGRRAGTDPRDVEGVAATDRGREELVTWPGAFGVLGVGLMIAVGLEDIESSADWLAYLVGGVIVALSVAGYLAVRRGAFVVTAIVGLGIAYLQLADDVIADIGDEDDFAIIAAATVAVFVLAVTAVGWLLRTRAVSGVVAGVIGVVGINIVLLVIVASQSFGGFFGSSDLMSEGSSGRSSDFDTDVYVILAIAAVLTVVWALAAALDGNPGFTVLAIAMPATVVPLATYVLAVEHPTWWGVALGGVGALLLALAGLRQLVGRRRRH